MVPVIGNVALLCTTIALFVSTMSLNKVRR